MIEIMIKELVEISKYAGMREDLVQAGGGNASVKINGEEMLIKSSGYNLSDVSKEEGYSLVNYKMIRQYLETLNDDNISEQEILERALIKGNRPSIETFLHALTGKVTLHVHSLSVNVLAVRKDGLEELRSLFPDALLVGYATPGIKLAKLYFEVYKAGVNEENKIGDIVFLKNHGLIISGENAEDVIQKTEMVCQRIEEKFGIDNSGYRKSYEIYKTLRKSGINSSNIVVKAENLSILNLLKEYKGQLWNYQFCPDCIVYCGKTPFIFKENISPEEIRNYVKKNGVPSLIQYKENIYIYAPNLRKARDIESVLAFSARVEENCKGEIVDILEEKEQNFLLNWDAEKYRQKAK